MNSTKAKSTKETKGKQTNKAYNQMANPINMQTSVMKNIVQFPVYKKINELYGSILDAKNVLSKYKPHLSSVVSIEAGCITPLVESKNLPMVFYKREDLTSIKAYKVRGALYQMSKIVKSYSNDVTVLRKLHFVAASTGNHALGVLKAAEILKVSNVTICISENVTEFKKEKLNSLVSKLQERGMNAKLVIKGENFDQTNKIAKELVEIDEYGFYIDPYNTHKAVAGQGTIGLELLSQLENKSKTLKNFDRLEEITVIVPIGGGGLISGISCALKSGLNEFPRLKHLKLNVVGVSLEDLNSKYGDAIKVESFGAHNNVYIRHLVDLQLKMDDSDMKKGMDLIEKDLGVSVEGASAGTLTPVLKNLVKPSEKNLVICILSGGNS